MKRLLSFIIVMFFSCQLKAQFMSIDKNTYVIVVHGGAGSIQKGGITAEEEALYKAGLTKAMEEGMKILAANGNAAEAVQKAIMILEDDTMFNAGRGSVLNEKGYVEMDASIMDGEYLRAGAVAGVTTLKNPINAARLVMDKGVHVMLAGKGAEDYAKKLGAITIDPKYFITQHALKELKKAKDDIKDKKTYLEQPGNTDRKYGTVGAVALDKFGNLAAGTSTGGMTNKKPGRIGDSPVIGAGTYADNNSCAVSCTGWGEYFIKLGMAKAICDRVELSKMTVQDAAKLMVQTKLADMGASGGVIVLDRKGNIAIEFNTVGMNRGYMKSDGTKMVELYKD